jgi:hypothetical protein
MLDGSIIFKCSRRHSIEGTSRDEARVWRVEGLISLHLPSAPFLLPPLFSSCATSNLPSCFYGSHGAKRGTVACGGGGRGEVGRGRRHGGEGPEAAAAHGCVMCVCVLACVRGGVVYSVCG